MNFNALPMLGRSLSKAVQGSEGNRQNLPSLGRHAQHDFQALEDGDKPDSRAVREAVSTMTACLGVIVNAVGVNVSGGNNGGAVARRNVLLLLRARPDWDSEDRGAGACFAGRSRREAATDRPANGGQFGKLAEGVMMGSERKRARQRA